jgi:hypothetical protein
MGCSTVIHEVIGNDVVRFIREGKIFLYNYIFRYQHKLK